MILLSPVKKIYEIRSDNMMIGFMRNGRKPFRFVRLLAKTCAYNDIDLVYFSPRNVDIEKKTVKGQVLIKNKWMTKEVPIPPFIDTTPYCFKNEKVTEFLRKNSTLSTDSIGTKDEIYNKIKEDGEFAHLLIPTGEYSNFEEFLNFINTHKTIVIKPKAGLRGHNIYMVKQLRRNKFLISYQQSEEKMNKEKLKQLYKDTWHGDGHILQKYITSRTKSGDPFDCRVRLEKNGRGKWSVAIYLVRIGSNQKVVSNVAQGGSVTTLTAFLEGNFPEEKERLKEAIRRIAKTLPYKIEELFDVNFSALGLDIGIDQEANLYLFEVENGPGTEFGEGQIASAKTEYYNYISKKLS